MALDPRIAEQVIRDLLLYERLSNSLGDGASRLLSSLFDDIAAEIARADPNGPRIPRYRKDRLAKLIAEVERRVPDAYAQLLKLARVGDDAADIAGLAHIGRDTAKRQAGHLRFLLGDGKAVAVADAGVSLNMAKAIIDTEPLNGALLKDWFADQSRKTTFQTSQQIRLGVARGETIDDMVRRVRGRAGGYLRDESGKVIGREYVGGVLETSTREARAIVRTAVNDIANRAALLNVEANRGIVGRVRFVATLDGRTSERCMAADGREWAADDPTKLIPPLHVSCRSILVPVIDWGALGLPTPKPGTRASEGGQVSAAKTYGDWLREQSAEKQREILGRGRARLFREGKIDMRDLVRQDGGRVKLSELEKLAA